MDLVFSAEYLAKKKAQSLAHQKKGSEKAPCKGFSRDRGCQKGS